MITSPDTLPGPQCIVAPFWWNKLSAPTSPSPEFSTERRVTVKGALLSDYVMVGVKSRCWLYVLCFALIISVTVFVILDLKYPRLGLIRIDAFDQALVELRE
jgi:hypothetical protein